jgi:hypothetical protein
MFLVAQHVLRPQTGEEGINAFHYVHHVDDWAGPPAAIPDQDPGELVNKTIAVAPGGNRVRSYLDIVAPDKASSVGIRQSLLVFLLDHEQGPLPWVGDVTQYRFRIGMEDQLAQNWRHEIGALYSAAMKARLPG